MIPDRKGHTMARKAEVLEHARTFEGWADEVAGFPAELQAAVEATGEFPNWGLSGYKSMSALAADAKKAAGTVGAMALAHLAAGKPFEDGPYVPNVKVSERRSPRWKELAVANFDRAASLRDLLKTALGLVGAYGLDPADERALTRISRLADETMRGVAPANGDYAASVVESTEPTKSERFDPIARA